MSIYDATVCRPELKSFQGKHIVLTWPKRFSPTGNSFRTYYLVGKVLNWDTCNSLYFDPNRHGILVEVEHTDSLYPNSQMVIYHDNIRTIIEHTSDASAYSDYILNKEAHDESDM